MSEPRPPLIPLSRPWLEPDDFSGTERLWQTGQLISGPMVEKFENRFRALHGTEHAVAVSTGSAALWVAQSALGVGPGDEVIVPDMTFVTTATSCMLLGARPVFVDIDLATYTIAPEKIEAKITPRTKGIIPVHYAGQTAEMDPILQLAREKHLWVLEDAAQAHLSLYRNERRAGTMGTAAIFSFTPTKPMTTGEGGMITTCDAAIAEKCRLFRNIGDTGTFRWDLLGWNFRMPEVIGMLGLKQIERLEEAVRARKKLAARLSAALEPCDAVITPFARTPGDHTFQTYTIRLRPEVLAIDRDTFMARLLDLGVSSRVYYPTLHDQKVFARFERQPDSEFPDSLAFAHSAVTLPIYPTLAESDVDRIADAVISIARDERR